MAMFHAHSRHKTQNKSHKSPCLHGTDKLALVRGALSVLLPQSPNGRLHKNLSAPLVKWNKIVLLLGLLKAILKGKTLSHPVTAMEGKGNGGGGGVCVCVCGGDREA